MTMHVHICHNQNYVPTAWKTKPNYNWQYIIQSSTQCLSS